MRAAEVIGTCAGRVIASRYGPWVLEALGPRTFVAGGAMRELVEASFKAGPFQWAPKDLDVFVLDEELLEKILRRARAAGYSVDSSKAPYYVAKHRNGAIVDVVLYDLGGNMTPGAALSTFDFSVNAVGFDGERLIFSDTWGESALGDVRDRVCRASLRHLFLRRPLRAARRLTSILGKGYKISEEDLRAYTANFGSHGN